MARVFVIGAGASKFAGYPLALGLWFFVRDTEAGEAMAKERRAAVIEVMDQILKLVPPSKLDRPNLEELFTLLDLAELGTEPLSLKHIDWRTVRPKLIGLITWAFLWKQYELDGDLRGGHSAASILQQWTNLLRAGDTLISFNWDILHEAALWRAKKWHYADGYGFGCADEAGDIRSPIKNSETSWLCELGTTRRG